MKTNTQSFSRSTVLNAPDYARKEKLLPLSVSLNLPLDTSQTENEDLKCMLINEMEKSKSPNQMLALIFKRCARAIIFINQMDCDTNE
jgi:hypothetical protein